MLINVTYDASVAGAPAAFKTGVGSVVQFFENTFTDPVTINLSVGYGEVNGQPLSGALGSSSYFIHNYTYTQIRNALVSDAKSTTDAAVVASMPIVTPVSGTFSISQAEAVALGLSLASTPATGSVGFSNTVTFDYDESNGITPGQYDFFGVVAHEISEVMGRTAGLGTDTPNVYSVLDLLRYSSPGFRSFVSTQAAYFSTDGGNTNLASFNTDPSGDFGDWANSVSHDAFRAFALSGTSEAVTSADLMVLDALGYNLTSASPSVSSLTTSPAVGHVNAGAAVTLTANMTTSVTVTGVPTLTLNDGGTATYDARLSTPLALVFDYTVGPTDATTNLAVVSVNKPAGAAIKDIAGHDADMSSAASALGTGLQIGTVTNGTVVGTSANNVFYALATSLSFSGGGGHDTIVFDGTRSQYTVATNADGSVTVSDSAANRDGSHNLLNVEHLQFTDTTSFVENSDNANVARLYSAAFNRAPDVTGLNFWEDTYAGNVPARTNAIVGLAETTIGSVGGSIAGYFISSPEFQQKYGPLDDTGFVTQLYANVLGRAPDTGGLNFWLGVMHNGDANGVHYTEAMVLTSFAESAENIAKTGGDWLFAV